MAEGKAVCAIFVCTLVIGVLQICGWSLDEWAKDPNSNCRHIQLKSEECGSGDGDVYRLHLFGTAFCELAVLGIITLSCGTPSSSDDSDINQCFVVGLAFLLPYPFTGILILAGCIKFSTHYPASALGPSFYLCLSAGIIHTLFMIFLLTVRYIQVCHDDTTDSVPANRAIPTVSQTVDTIDERQTETVIT